MSLSFSSNGPSADSSFFVRNVGSDSLPVIPASILRLQGPAAQITPTTAAPNGSLSLGPNPATFATIVLSDAPSTASVNGTLFVNGSLTSKSVGALPATLDTYINRDIHGFSDTGYAAFSSVQGAGVIPNPVALSIGLWSVIAAAAAPGNEGAQVSAVCFWDGAAWTGSGVSTSFTGGPPSAPNCAILPVAGGATLNLGGVAIPAANTITFRQLLAAP